MVFLLTLRVNLANAAQISCLRQLKQLTEKLMRLPDNLSANKKISWISLSELILFAA